MDTARSVQFFSKTVQETEYILQTQPTGLSAQQVKERLKQYGYNELKEKKKINPIVIFLRQFHSIVIYILFGALMISYALGEYIDASVIFGILLFNAFFGFIQEYKSEKSLSALKKLTGLKAKVIREGTVVEGEARELVLGDILVLEEGDKIAADARITSAVHLKTQEAALTGESNSVEKLIEKLPINLILGDQKNMVFSGTIITSGRGRGIVVATGMNTEIGKIAGMIDDTEEQMTPLQKNLDKIGKIMGYSTIFICFVVFSVTVLKGELLLPAFLTAVALAVAAIPEGLPAVITITLALSVQRMVKKNALIRKLASVETLGCTTVICSDKTGTLTKNEMTVRQIYANGKVIEVTGTGYKSQGEFFIHGKKIDPREIKEIMLILNIGALNNNAHIEREKGYEKVIGDPTEACLLVSAAKAGIERNEQEKKEPRVDEIIFDSRRKRMSTIHRVKDTYLIYTKGAADCIVPLCSKIYERGKVRSITQKDRKTILEATHSFSAAALRVLCFAYKECKTNSVKKRWDEDDESDLIFVGLQAMMDPPREEVRCAIQTCKDAGIKVIMITGDHESTAKAIGEELGIGTNVMSGRELAEKKDLADVTEHIDIYARVNPEHKLKIVEALQRNGHVVAMTGDGVNDAPALKQADIGVAMGITGTDVSKEASDMVLLDDNFTSIVHAVEEGRGIYGNIKKYLGFLLSGNISEVLIVFILIVMSFPLPLIATQILLINLVTDGFPALALSVDPFEPKVMNAKPRKKNEKLYNGLSPYLLYYPLVMTVAAVALFSHIYTTESNLVKAQTSVFLLISVFELFEAFSCRSTVHSSFVVGIFRNPWLVGAIGASAAVLGVVIYVPLLQPLFGTVALSFVEVLTIVIISMSGFVTIEIMKTIQRS